MYSQGKNKAYSGQGNFAGNFLTFLVCFAIFVAALYMVTFWNLATAWWPTIVLMALAIAAFAIPQHILGRSDSNPAKTANESLARATVDAEYRSAIDAEKAKH